MTTSLTRADAEQRVRSIRNGAATLAMASFEDFENLTREELIDLEVAVRQAARRIAPMNFGPDETPAERIVARVISTDEDKHVDLGSALNARLADLGAEIKAQKTPERIDEHGGWYLHPNHVNADPVDPAGLSIRDRALDILSRPEYDHLSKSARLYIATRAGRAHRPTVTDHAINGYIAAIIAAEELS